MQHVASASMLTAACSSVAGPDLSIKGNFCFSSACEQKLAAERN